MSPYRYSLPQGKIRTMPLNSTEYEMAAIMFGNANIKRNPSTVLSPMPTGLFCKDKRNERFQGEAIDGFSNSFCTGFYPVQTDVGFCTSKGFDVKKVLKYHPDYWNFMEAENQQVTSMKEEGNRNAENTIYILTNVFEDLEHTIMPRTIDANHDIQLQINQFRDIPQILHGNKQATELRSLTLKPGHEYVIEISPMGQMSTLGFHGLRLDQRNCRLSHEVEEDSIFQIYTKRNCEHECRIKKASENCKCIPWDFIFKVKGYKECDLFGRTCFFHAIESMTHDSGNLCPHCIDECDYIEYRKEMRKLTPLQLRKDFASKRYCNKYLCFRENDWYVRLSFLFLLFNISINQIKNLFLFVGLVLVLSYVKLPLM